MGNCRECVLMWLWMAGSCVFASVRPRERGRDRDSDSGTDEQSHTHPPTDPHTHARTHTHTHALGYVSLSSCSPRVTVFSMLMKILDAYVRFRRRAKFGRMAVVVPSASAWVGRDRKTCPNLTT